MFAKVIKAFLPKSTLTPKGPRVQKNLAPKTIWWPCGPLGVKGQF